MNQFNIPVAYVNLIFNILNNRLLYVRSKDGSVEGPNSTSLGLAQGSPLSPLLFNLYTASLHDILPENIKLVQYADDLVILAQGEDIGNIVIDINEALEKIRMWLQSHNFKLSVEKSAAVLFRKKNQIRDYLRLSMKT